ncbi:ATP synthase F1 subunit epsilon [Candidatus Parcubacteria bacterium]|nr:MAG: ATP synthase F1 subunit epsilon [Candidatus Parcubacteria bacterium]
MSKLIKFEIVTPERKVMEEEISQVTVPTLAGEITVLPEHIPLVGVVVPGVIEGVDKEGNPLVVSVSGGFVHVLKYKIVILADTAERAEELDESRLQEARQRAEDLKKDTRHMDQERFANINASLAKELARGKAVKRWKKIKNLNK